MVRGMYDEAGFTTRCFAVQKCGVRATVIFAIAQSKVVMLNSDTELPLLGR